MQQLSQGGQGEARGRVPCNRYSAAGGAQSILPTALPRKPLHLTCSELPQLLSQVSTLFSIKHSASVNRPPTVAMTVSPFKC